MNELMQLIPEQPFLCSVFPMNMSFIINCGIRWQKTLNSPCVMANAFRRNLQCCCWNTPTHSLRRLWQIAKRAFSIEVYNLTYPVCFKFSSVFNYSFSLKPVIRTKTVFSSWFWWNCLVKSLVWNVFDSSGSRSCKREGLLPKHNF